MTTRSISAVLAFMACIGACSEVDPLPPINGWGPKPPPPVVNERVDFPDLTIKPNELVIVAEVDNLFREGAYGYFAYTAVSSDTSVVNLQMAGNPNHPVLVMQGLMPGIATVTVTVQEQPSSPVWGELGRSASRSATITVEEP